MPSSDDRRGRYFVVTALRAWVPLGTIALVRMGYWEPEFLDVAWSPTGRKIAFGVADRQGSRGGLYIVNTDGSRLRRIGGGMRPAWSPDGRWLAFMRARVWVARANGSTQRTLPTPGALDFAWSPDSREIAYTNDKGIWIVPVRGGRPRLFAAAPGARQLAWSRR